MDRLVLFGSAFFTLVIATNGSMTSAVVMARKGYNPRLGALIGFLIGAAGGMIPALLLHLAGGRGALTVLTGIVGSVAALAALWNLTPDRARQGTDLPSGDHLRRNIAGRHVRGTIMKGLFIGSIVLALGVLAVLLWTIIDRSIGLTAVQYAVQPEALHLSGEPTGRALANLSDDELQQVLAENVRVARLRVFILQKVTHTAPDQWANISSRAAREVLQGKAIPDDMSDIPFNQLDKTQAAYLLALNLERDAVETLIFDEVIKPEVVQGWSLWQSLTERARIEAAVTAKYPDAEVKWRSWVNWEFLSSPLDPRKPDATGIRPGIKGSLLVILITMLIAFPLGVGAAIYLEEYAANNKLNRIIQTNINNLAGVPSIIYGMLGLAIFVRLLEQITSGQAFGVDTANGRTVLSAGFTLALLILPLIIINAQEALRAVPGSLRQASYGLGATKWQTIWHHVLPYSMPGILTGTILAISRAIGETAPLILVGGATYLTRDPEGPFSIFTALPLLIYRWTTLPQAEFRNAAAAAIIVLLLLLLTFNSLAVILRNRFSRRLS